MAAHLPMATAIRTPLCPTFIGTLACSPTLKPRMRLHNGLPSIICRHAEHATGAQCDDSCAKPGNGALAPLDLSVVKYAPSAGDEQAAVGQRDAYGLIQIYGAIDSGDVAHGKHCATTEPG